MSFFQSPKIFITTIFMGMPSACVATETASPCQYQEFRHLMGKPSAVVFEMELPANHRHIPGDKVPELTDPSRLSIMHSDTLEKAKTDAGSIVVGLLCG